MVDLRYDVAVIGGGPAGTVAAVASARSGARTILIEKNGYLGGALTACGTGPQMTFHAGGTQVVRGIPEEFVSELVCRGFSTGHLPDATGFCASTTAFDTEGVKVVWEEMAMNARVVLMYHSMYVGCVVEAGRIQFVQVHTKNGIYRIFAKVFIDASADADLAADAGVRCNFGRDGDHLVQPMTMNFHVYHVDREKLCRYVMENLPDMYAGTPKNLAEMIHYDISGAFQKVLAAKNAGKLHVERDSVLCFETNTNGEYIVNMSRITRKNPLDPFDLTEAEIIGRKQVWEIYDFLRAYIPGFENARIAYSGPEVGIRESRRIIGRYILTEEDLLENKMFFDAVVMGAYPVDIHAPDGDYTTIRKLKKNSWYAVPYRCMVTEEVQNLIVAGRCVSATHGACAAVRVTPTVMGIGQAAGTAAAVSIQAKTEAHTLHADLLRQRLREDGVFLDVYNG